MSDPISQHGADAASVQAYLDRNQALREALGIAHRVEASIRPLASGEHNMNYVLDLSDGRRFVIRVNLASQLGLNDQVAYEHRALTVLTNSGRTPRPHFLDDSPEAPGNGVLVIDFLPGVQLDYENPDHMREAAAVLADIHSVTVPPDAGLFAPPDPLQDQFGECRRMFAAYRGSAFEEPAVTRYVERFFQRAEEALCSACLPEDCTHIQNTEATSDQFLMNEPGQQGYMVDWEKPIVGEVAQDVAYFLAPTSTIWQNGPILDDEQRARFVSDYWNAVAGRFPQGNFEERFAAFSMMNNLRGVTWSCQAMVEYHDPTRPLKRDRTFKLLSRYLGEEFLTYLDKHVFV